MKKEYTTNCVECRSLQLQTQTFRTGKTLFFFCGLALLYIAGTRANGQMLAGTISVSLLTEELRTPLMAAKAAMDPAGLPLADMTLQGLVLTKSGSVEQRSAISLYAKRGGYTAVRITLPNETQTETRGFTPESTLSSDLKRSRLGYRKTSAGTEQLPGRQSVVEPYWFEPEFLLDIFLAQQSWVGARDDAQKSQNPTAVRLSMSRKLPSNDIVAETIRVASTISLILAPDTFLPMEVSYIMPAGRTRSPPAHFQVRFSDYRFIDGHQVPWHITEIVNGVFYRDINIDSVKVDSGLSDDVFDPPTGALQ